MRVGRTDALREDIAHAGRIHHSAHGATGDDSGTRDSRFEHHLAGAKAADDWMRQASAL